MIRPRRFGFDPRLDHRVHRRGFDIAIGVGFDHRQRRSDRDQIANLACQLDNDARYRRFHLDGRLVGHHVGQLRVFLDALANFDVPGDDFGLGDAFADVGQTE